MSTEQPKKKHRGGMPAYKPTEQERRFVAVMSGMGLTTEMIRKVIGGRGKTGKLSKTALWKHFSRELECGSAEMHALLASKIRKAVEEEKPWAILAAARNLSGFRWDRYDKSALLPPSDNVEDIHVHFVLPDKKPEPLDVTPPQPTGYAPDAPADYSKVAIEPPRPRRETGFGIIETPREPPQSVFDRGGGPGDWMK